MSKSARKGATALKVGGKSPGWDSLAGGSLMAMMPFVVTCTKPSVVKRSAENTLFFVGELSQGPTPLVTTLPRQVQKLSQVTQTVGLKFPPASCEMLCGQP